MTETKIVGGSRTVATTLRVSSRMPSRPGRGQLLPVGADVPLAESLMVETLDRLDRLHRIGFLTDDEWKRAKILAEASFAPERPRCACKVQPCPWPDDLQGYSAKCLNEGRAHL